MVKFVDGRRLGSAFCFLKEYRIEDDKGHLPGYRGMGRMGVGFVSLHGAAPARKRGTLISQFRQDPACKVFLSTDAGGVGLNLQAASQVIHFLTFGSIEERAW